MNKQVFRIISDTGRNIVATNDHPFLTSNGWVDVGNLNEGDLVAVYPMLESFSTPNPPSVENGKIVVDEDMIKKMYPNRFKHYIKELKDRELLPFTVNNYWAEIIARLQGHMFTDGHCGKNNLEFYCGSMNDALQISKDIIRLGFKPSRIDKKISKSKIKGRDVVSTNYRLTKGGALHALLVVLGTPVGRKTDLIYDIPRWLYDAELSVKREFLSAYMGGDGGKARYCDNGSIGKVKIEDLFFHKAINVKDKGIEFAEKLKYLFKLFNVNTKN